MLVDVDCVVSVAKCEYHAGKKFAFGIGRHDGMQSVGYVGKVAVGFHIVEQVHPKIV